jgi:hypothetical protein
VIIPAWIIPKTMLVDDPALTFLCNIRYPNASDADSALLEPNQHLFPKWFIQLLTCVSYTLEGKGDVACLDEAIRMTTYDRNVSRLGIRVVWRDILFDCKMQDIFLLIGSCLGILANVLAWNQMLDNAELGGHFDS